MKRATYEDVLNAPEDKIAEILDGELYLSPRPAPKHAAGASALGGLLWVPDLAGWRRDRMATLPTEAFFSLTPRLGV